MLKALGSTMVQVTERTGAGHTADRRLLPDDERSRRVATRAQRRRQLRTVLFLFITLIAMVAVFSSPFHTLMEREGRAYSWPTSVYWTLTTMTTLGFGDITFESDAGRIFPVVVLLSGSVFLLVMLPFVFIQFVFMPWNASGGAPHAPLQRPCATT